MAGTNSPRYSNLDGSALRSVLIDEGLQLCALAWQHLEQAESVFKRAEVVEDTVDAVRHARSCMMVAQERALQARVALADQNAKEWVFEAATAVHHNKIVLADQDKSAQATRKKKRVNILTPRLWLRRCWCKRQKADTAEADTAVQEQPPWSIEEEEEHCDDWEDDPEDLCGPEPLPYGRSRC